MWYPPIVPLVVPGSRPCVAAHGLIISPFFQVVNLYHTIIAGSEAQKRARRARFCRSPNTCTTLRAIASYQLFPLHPPGRIYSCRSTQVTNRAPRQPTRQQYRSHGREDTHPENTQRPRGTAPGAKTPRPQAQPKTKFSRPGPGTTPRRQSRPKPQAPPDRGARGGRGPPTRGRTNQQQGRKRNPGPRGGALPRPPPGAGAPRRGAGREHRGARQHARTSPKGRQRRGHRNAAAPPDADGPAHDEGTTTAARGRRRAGETDQPPPARAAPGGPTPSSAGPRRRGRGGESRAAAGPRQPGPRQRRRAAPTRRTDASTQGREHAGSTQPARMILQLFL